MLGSIEVGPLNAGTVMESMRVDARFGAFGSNATSTQVLGVAADWQVLTNVMVRFWLSVMLLIRCSNPTGCGSLYLIWTYAVAELARAFVIRVTYHPP